MELEPRDFERIRAFIHANTTEFQGGPPVTVVQGALDRIEAQVERLREALERIANLEGSRACGCIGSHDDCCIAIAEEILADYVKPDLRGPRINHGPSSAAEARRLRELPPPVLERDTPEGGYGR